jgi:hypothetical protein
VFDDDEACYPTCEDVPEEEISRFNRSMFPPALNQARHNTACSGSLVLSCLIRATGWATPRWGGRLRCWLAAHLPLPQQWTCSAVQIYSLLVSLKVNGLIYIPPNRFRRFLVHKKNTEPAVLMVPLVLAGH